VLALLFLPLLTPYSALLRRLLPARIVENDPARPLYLDPSAQEVPAIALGAAARESLRLADMLEIMLQGLRDVFEKADRRQITRMRRLDDVLDKLNTAIKAYLTTLDPEALDDADHRRVSEILAFAMHMEQAGDIVDRNLLALAARKLKRGLAFSTEGQADLLAMIDRLTANLRAAASLFMTQDERAARLLAAEKESFRSLEAAAVAAHFARLRAGRVDTTETSSLHLDAVRQLTQINTLLVAAAAYPVLESKGELLPSRLRQSD
ncbi:MAG TPA: PhoU domain-containing protein, partial [Rhodopila sp.]|nr:PhoU domain-containing protein [Rhodopila sp.]